MNEARQLTRRTTWLNERLMRKLDVEPAWAPVHAAQIRLVVALR